MSRFADVVANAQIDGLLVEPPQQMERAAGARHASKTSPHAPDKENRAAMEARLLLLERQLRAHRTLIVAARTNQAVAEIPGLVALPSLEAAPAAPTLAALPLGVCELPPLYAAPSATSVTGPADEAGQPAKRSKPMAEPFCAALHPNPMAAVPTLAPTTVALDAGDSTVVPQAAGGGALQQQPQLQQPMLPDDLQRRCYQHQQFRILPQH